MSSDVEVILTMENKNDSGSNSHYKGGINNIAMGN